MYPQSPWLQPCLTPQVSAHGPHFEVTQSGILEFITKEAPVATDTMASFSTYFHQKGTNQKSNFWVFPFPTFSTPFHQGILETVCHHLVVERAPKGLGQGSALPPNA